MLSPADLMVAFVAGLLLFGPEGLPQMARKAGRLVRDVQNTSQTFLYEMERAAELRPVPSKEAAHEEAGNGSLPFEEVSGEKGEPSPKY